MGLSDFVAAACLAAACLLVGLGIVRLWAALRRFRFARLDADYRAAALTINAGREVRAGKSRAAAREWGRVA